MIDVEERLAAILKRRAGTLPTPAAPAVAQVYAGARRRHRRQLVRRGALATVLLLAVTAAGVRTVHQSAPTITSDETRLERALVDGGMLAPGSDSGFTRLVSLHAMGAEHRTDGGPRHIVVGSVGDGPSWTVDPVFLGSDAENRSTSAGINPVEVDGATGYYAVDPAGVLRMSWASDGWFYQLAGARRDHGLVRVDQAVAVAGRLDSRSGTVTYVPARSETVVYDGVAVGGTYVEARWVPDGTNPNAINEVSATLWSSPIVPGEPVWMATDPRSKGAAARRTNVVFYGSARDWRVVWEEPAGTRQELETFGLDLGKTLDIVEGLRPLTTKAVRKLVAGLDPDLLSVNLIGPTGDLAISISRRSTTASTAVPAPVAAVGRGPNFLDAAAADSVAPGDTVVRPFVVGSPPYSDSVVLHTLDDRWVGLTLDIQVSTGSCQAGAVRDVLGRITGWKAPCTGAAYNADGTCRDDSRTCYVGLSTFPVKVENGRILADADPAFDVPGLPSRQITG